MTMTTMNVKELIQMLPQDIIQYIIPFTYMPQPVTLLLDIKNFVETRETISEIYYNRNKDLLQYEKNADKNWLVNDILLFVKLNKNERYRSFLYMHQEFI
jgi:hypothetical protein